MTKFPYSTVPGKIHTILEKIRDVGVPSKADTKWLKSVGFKSGNDSSLLRVLKGIEFIDDSGVPSDRWRNYRGPDHARILADAIRQGYPDLFSTYNNAYERAGQDLQPFFSLHSGAGASTVDLMVSTFKNLCEHAEFSELEAVTSPIAPDATQPLPNIVESAPFPYSVAGTGLAININVQLSIPETTDAKVYDNFFAAMKKHLLLRDDEL